MQTAVADRPVRKSVSPEKVNKLRKRRGLSRAELAADSGVSYSVIVRLEQGRKKRLSAESLALLAETLGTTMNSLME